jgi:hypothetical protein
MLHNVPSNLDVIRWIADVIFKNAVLKIVAIYEKV